MEEWETHGTSTSAEERNEENNNDVFGMRPPDELCESAFQPGHNQGDDESMKARIWLALDATG